MNCFTAHAKEHTPAAHLWDFDSSDLLWTNSPRISTAAGVGVCCGSCARCLRLCEQRERERQFMRRSTRERRVVLIRIYLAKQCVYIYGKGCNKTTIASAAAVSICSPGGGVRSSTPNPPGYRRGGGCLLDEVVRREQRERELRVRFENGRQKRQFKLRTTESKG